MTTPHPLLTARELADVFGVSDRTVHRWFATYDMFGTVIKITPKGRHYTKMDVHSLAKWLDRHRSLWHCGQYTAAQQERIEQVIQEQRA